MNRLLRLFIVLAVLVSCCSVFAGTRHKAPAETSLVRDNNSFALDLYRNLAGQDGNILVSPYSLSLVMAIAYSGAAGDTRQEIGHVLHIPPYSGNNTEAHIEAISAQFGALTQAVRGNIVKQGYELFPAVGMWAQQNYPFIPNFLEQCQKHFNAGLNKVDFRKSPDAVQKDVNAWVAKHTSNTIQELTIPDIKNPLNRLLVCSAVYFKGTWAAPFKKKYTRLSEFRVSKDKTIQVHMMHQKEEFEYADVGDVRVLKLRYFGTDMSFGNGVINDVSMIILLPEADDGLSQLENTLTPKLLDEYLGRTVPTMVDLYLPRFKIEFETNVADNLRKMGINAAFDAYKADFSGIDGKKHWMYLGPVVHKVCVEVDETGTVAAESSAWMFRVMGMVGPGVFKADHPFLFIIRHNITGSLLFIGRVSNPKG
jgi:serpin B